MKKILFIISIITALIAVEAKAQTSNLDFANDKIAERGGIYFYFPIPEHEVMLNLFNEISVDGFKNDQVYAYANSHEFETFLTYGIDFTPNYDYYITPKAVSMATTVAQMASWDRYPTHAVYVQMMQNFVANYPSLCRLDTIGTSINGWPIICVVISDNIGADEDEPEFWWSGTMHGDEITGYVLLLRLADYLLSNYGTNSQITNLLNNVEIYINPLANPDGTFFGSSSGTIIASDHRYNANDADLNRSFTRPDGIAPPYSTQPETQCMMDYSAAHDFVMSANTHGGTECVNYPWDTWLSAVNPHADNNWWYYVSYVYADEVELDAPTTYFDGPGQMYNIGGTNTTGVTHGADWYYAYGSRQDYMNYFRNCRETTLELSDTKQVSGSSLPSYWNYNRDAMLLYMDQVLFGFRGIVTNACTGNPLADVKVEISGHDEDNSWVYSSAPVGNYHRPIYAGTYNVTFSKSGYTSKTLPVTVVNNASTRLDVQLVPTTVASPAFTASPTSVAIGGTVNFTDQTSGAVTSRSWTFEQGNPPSATTQNPAVVYNNIGTFDATLQIVSAGCTLSLTKPNYINVYTPGAPTPGFTCDVTTTCIGTVSFTNTSTDATSYLWDFGDGSYSEEVNPVHTYTSDGVYTVSLTATNAYGNNILTQTNLITVDLPDAPVTTGVENCGPASLTLNATGNGTLEWYDAATNGNLITTGTSYTNNFTNSTTYYVQSGRTPHTYYVGNTDSETNGMNHTNNGYYLIFSTYTDITLVSVEVNAGTVAGNRIIQLRDNNGNVLQSVTANLPTGVSRVTLNFDITAGNNYQLRCGTSNPNLYRNDSGVDYPYTVANVISITGTNATSQAYYYYFYDWEVLVGDECISARTPVSAVINEVPNAPTVSGGGTFCANSATLTASGAGDHNMYWQGTNANGTSTVNETSSYEVTASGTYYFRIQTGSGCWGPSAGATVTLNTLPGAVTVSGGGTFCGGPVTLTTTGGSGGTIYFQGNTSGGTSTATPATSQSVSSSGTYYFRARSAAGCWGPEGSATVTINAAPGAVTVSGGGTFCGGTVTLTASGGTGGTIYWQGTTNGGTSTATASSSQTVSASGTYYFRAYSPAGCWGPQGSATVTINAVPAAVTVSGGGTQCGGSMTLTATGGTGGTIYWQGTTSGGTSTATASSSQTVSASGTYYFRARSAQGCWGPEGSATVSINTVPSTVTVAGGGVYCGTNATLTATGGTGGTIYWQGTTSGGTSTATASSSQIVSVSGTYYFRARSAQGCWGPEGNATVTISPAILLNLSTTEESAPGANDGSVTATITGGTAPFSYTWNTSATGNPLTGLAAGYYCVTVEDNAGCTAQNCVTVTLANQPNPPIAQFSADIHNGCGSLTVQFTDNSTNNPTEWDWNFGDGSTSEEQNPIHTYLAPGHYTVILTVSNDDGSDDITKNEFIHVWPIVEIDIASTEESAEGAADGTATVTIVQGIHPFTFLWDNGGETATIEGLTAGTYCVTVTDSVGCQANMCVEVSLQAVNPLNALFSFEQSGVCGSSTLSFHDESTGDITSWNWDFGDGTQSNEQNPVHNYVSPGNFTVLLIISDGENQSTYDAVVEVFEVPSLSFEVTEESSPGAADGEIVLSITGGAAPYQINWSNGQHTATITGLQAGDYSVAVVDNNGCYATSAVTVPLGTGIAVDVSELFLLYPNPASGYFNLTADHVIEQVTIMDATGRSCFSSNPGKDAVNIDIQHLPSGLYFVVCSTDQFSQVLKLVVR